MLEATARHMPSNPGWAHPRFGGEFRQRPAPPSPRPMGADIDVEAATSVVFQAAHRTTSAQICMCSTRVAVDAEIDRAAGQLLFTPEAGHPNPMPSAVGLGCCIRLMIRAGGDVTKELDCGADAARYLAAPAISGVAAMALEPGALTMRMLMMARPMRSKATMAMRHIICPRLSERSRV